MDLLLTRKMFKPEGVFGELSDMDGEQVVAATLEHSYDSSPKLPPGLYTCVRGKHRLHDGIPFDTFEITGVPGHEGILFHVGNYNKDSDGCVLLGNQFAGDMVTSSREAFDRFMALQAGCNSFLLAVQ